MSSKDNRKRFSVDISAAAHARLADYKRRFGLTQNQMLTLTLERADLDALEPYAREYGAKEMTQAERNTLKRVIQRLSEEELIRLRKELLESDNEE